MKPFAVIWVSYVAFLVSVFVYNDRHPRGCGPPSIEHAIASNEVILHAITANRLTGFELGLGSLEEQKHRLEEELQDPTAEFFYYGAQLQLELYPDGMLEVWLEYPPLEWLAEAKLDYRLVWAVDFSQGRLLSRAMPLGW
jgi:hypothetical protein